ncbi:MAG: FecR domain-containing protein [Bacteroidetes bacterium]|nr:FecR domain-containing protein [Bacteroidota bacterium]
MKQERFTYLINRLAARAITAEETAELQELLHELDDLELPEALSESWLNENALTGKPAAGFEEADKHAEAILAVDKSIDPGTGAQESDDTIISEPPVRRIDFFRMPWFRYAAAIIILVGAGLWLRSISNGSHAPAADDKKAQAAIVPGKDGAVLTLADGTQVVLDSVPNGVVAAQNGTQVVVKNGLLAYNPTTSPSARVSYNSVATPKGRQFRLVLPDGSRVWLNAASFIKYPTVFSGGERLVEVKGEAYFEIEKDVARPFRVKMNDAAAVEVLGTSFNVNAYENEDAIRTTLLEGAVRINAYKHLQMLKPGQQAQVYPNEHIDVADGVDVSQVVAWKNGYFDFDKVDLRVMLRQLERWYDITVNYEGNPPAMVFKGTMDRNIQLSDIIRFLNASGIKTRLEGRALIISGS